MACRTRSESNLNWPTVILTPEKVRGLEFTAFVLDHTRVTGEQEGLPPPKIAKFVGKTDQEIFNTCVAEIADMLRSWAVFAWEQMGEQHDNSGLESGSLRAGSRSTQDETKSREA